MAAAMVAEAFLSASMQTLIERITSSEFRDFLKNRKLNVSLLDELENTLLVLNAVLNDAEEKQITNPLVKEWLDKLKDAVFDAEDLLDEINTQTLRCKVEQDSQNVTNQVRSFLSFTFSPFYRELNSKLEAISQKLKCFGNQIGILGLQSFTARVHKTPTTSTVNESVVVGRVDDKEKLLDILLSDEDEEGNGIGVITILGMGGLGKTTLAKLLYNDKRVQKHFDLKAWACVSEDFDAVMVTKHLVESVTKKVYNSNNLDFLQVELKQSLSNKMFLFVLDDLWNEKYSDWDDLVTPFFSGKRGSKIIVTTRQKRVAEFTHTFPIHELSLLSTEDCWCLLAKHAFGNEGTHRYPELEGIARQILKKCGGLPLAAKTLGGLLRSKVEKEEWNRILNSNLWELKHDDVIPALRLSYLYLPSHLKKCFAYCSIFPKDYLLDRKKLVLLWMAEGFIQQYCYGQETMELAANGYFDELLSRSLIQQYEGDREEKFVMHDLINDLAKVVSGKSCTCFEGNDIPNNVRHISYPQTKYDGSKKFESFYELRCLRTFLPRNINNSWPQYLEKKVPHDLLLRLKCLRVLSFSWYTNITELPNSIGNLVHLRYLALSGTSIEKLADATFTLYNLQTLILSCCRNLIELPSQIGNLINLRYLDISDTGLKEMPTQISMLHNMQTLILSFCQHLNELPSQIGNLINLRYLDISHTRLKEMPTQITMLHNLQTLILSNCQNLIELPSQIGNLTNLRHLDISETRLEEMPTQISMLHNLRGLSTFVVGRQQDGLRVKELKKLPHLPGKLSILKLQNVVDSMDAFEADLKSKEQIEELVLEWGSDTDDSQIPKDVLGKLQPSTNLRKLTIKYYGGTSFPNWVGDSSFSKITFLCISDCNYCLSLPPFGQLPYLKELWITRMELVQTIGHEFYCSKVDSSSFQPFPSLERLKFSEMPNWEEWLPFEGEGTAKLPFPCLKSLSLEKCPKLRGDLPNHLPSLTAVYISECNQLEEKSSGLHWITSIERLTIREGGRGLLCVLDNDSQCSLKHLDIGSCDSLQSLPRMILGSNCLQGLYLTNIQSLVSFPTDGLPTSLRSLIIENCEKLEFLAQEAWKNYTSLEELRIRNSCHSLTSFPLNCFPGLKSLYVIGCPNLESFTQVGGSAAPNLEYFEVSECERIKSMSEVQFDTLTALRQLILFDLPNLESLPQCGLPSNLRGIRVNNCKGLSSMATAGWGFQRLTSLLHFSVSGDDIVHNLLKEQLLPTSLVNLHIKNLSYLKLLEGKGLRHLTSLEQLWILDCPNLESLPEDELPSSLVLLVIEECPRLEERYGNKRGKHWSKIAHIPAVKINGEVI